MDLDLIFVQCFFETFQLGNSAPGTWSTTCSPGLSALYISRHGFWILCLDSDHVLDKTRFKFKPIMSAFWGPNTSGSIGGFKPSATSLPCGLAHELEWHDVQCLQCHWMPTLWRLLRTPRSPTMFCRSSGSASILLTSSSNLICTVTGRRLWGHLHGVVRMAPW